MKRLLHLAAWLLAFGTAGAEALRPADFHWRATVDAAPHHGLVKQPLPAEALQRLQSREAADLRVFDAQVREVPFALAIPPVPAEPPRQATGPWPALPLHAAQPGRRPPPGALQVRLQQGGGQQTLWVQLQPAAPDAAMPTAALPAALFDTRALKQAITGLTVQGRLPPNVPVQVSVSTSTDLANWEPVAVRGRIFRFEGEGAPANQTLELRQPLQLEGRYLRLDWSGYAGVELGSVTGLLAATRPPPVRPAALLPAPQRDGATALEWQLDFGTAIAQLEIATDRPDTLVPLRVLGRNRPTDPWRTLGQGVVYRLGPAGQESSNAPLVLASAPSVRLLRLEATHGQRLEGVPLAVKALFDPVEVVFVAGASGPYQLAAGRADTAPAALPLAMLAATTSVKLEHLPQARITATEAVPQAVRPAWLPRGLDSRTAALWAVLLAGVLVLGGVAWSLLRQLKAR